MTVGGFVLLVSGFRMNPLERRASLNRLINPAEPPTERWRLPIWLIQPFTPSFPVLLFLINLLVFYLVWVFHRLLHLAIIPPLHPLILSMFLLLLLLLLLLLCPSSSSPSSFFLLYGGWWIRDSGYSCYRRCSRRQQKEKERERKWRMTVNPSI